MKKLLFSKANIFSPNSMSKLERCVHYDQQFVLHHISIVIDADPVKQLSPISFYIHTPKPTYSNSLYCSAVCFRLSYGFWSRSSGLVVHTSEKLIMTSVQMRLVSPPPCSCNCRIWSSFQLVLSLFTLWHFQ